jgi:hypothetical protein
MELWLECFSNLSHTLVEGLTNVDTLSSDDILLNYSFGLSALSKYYNIKKIRKLDSASVIG